MTLSSDLFNKFTRTTGFNFTAQSNPPSKMSWNKCALGDTTVTICDNVVYFSDTMLLDGIKVEDNKKWVFTSDRVEFWHYRLDGYLHVFDFSIHPNIRQFNSIKPHICVEDEYSGNLENTQSILLFNIFIKSTIKNEHIQYKYF